MKLPKAPLAGWPHRLFPSAHGSLFWGSLLCAANLLAAPLDAHRVQAELRTTPRAALQQYFDCSPSGAPAYDAIATGQREWIRVAEEALRHSDACYTEGIQAALGAAMQREPARVLPLVGKTRLLSADRICIPQISAELAAADQLAELERSRRAIAQVRRWPRQKARCLRFIEAVERQVQTVR